MEITQISYDSFLYFTNMLFVYILILKIDLLWYSIRTKTTFSVVFHVRAFQSLTFFSSNRGRKAFPRFLAPLIYGDYFSTRATGTIFAYPSPVGYMITSSSLSVICTLVAPFSCQSLPAVASEIIYSLVTLIFIISISVTSPK